ncbi:hypothetical protein PVAP13_3KG376735 [Panicum virgatum]|uniref:Uncharacterized protein n=1 Tax=Panicum virgatum TaxID=38727 RepID=A0A8T0V4B8_PANVG|nr:hypothetical protein PVAP13_3KG376735 [Panicum virgatum]
MLASQLTGRVMLYYRGKACWLGWLPREGGATLRQCSSRTGTTRLSDEACEYAMQHLPPFRHRSAHPLLTSDSHTICLMVCLCNTSQIWILRFMQK